MQKSVVAALDALVDSCVDAKKGYAVAASSARDRTLRMRLSRLADERSAFIDALNAAMTALGGTPRNHDHHGAAPPRDAMLRDDKTVAEERLAADEVARKLYVKQMDRLAVAKAPQWVRALVVSQCAAIRSAEGDLAGLITTL